ncbi:MAG: hypothetical protein HY240_06895 [Actinobacteria bacterium]|nr:hypothetical protein [Actinomycetota bacterium]
MAQEAGADLTPHGDQEFLLSENLVRLVQIVFGLVVTQSLVLYQEIIRNPFGQGHWLAAMALASVYMAVIWSWFDWHEMMSRNPYKVLTKETDSDPVIPAGDPPGASRPRWGRFFENSRPFANTRDIERARVVSDLAVVTVYAYLLFAIEPFEKNPRGNVGYFLLGYVAIAITYLLSGFSRQMVHRWRSSNTPPIIRYLAVATVLATSYFFFYPLWNASSVWKQSKGPVELLSAYWVFAAGLATFVYRKDRKKFSRRRAAVKDASNAMRIGIDVDGVLGDQIAYMLPIWKKRFEVTLRFEDITEWNLVVGNSNIAIEIKNTMKAYPEYALSMKPHKHARRMAAGLYERGMLVVVSARPEEAAERTERWLLRHRFAYDSYETAKEALKSAHALDVLIDDYQGNIKDFLGSDKDRVAVLVDRPWNHERADLAEWIPDRLAIVTDLADVPDAVARLTNNRGMSQRTVLGRALEATLGRLQKAHRT